MFNYTHTHIHREKHGNSNCIDNDYTNFVCMQKVCKSVICIV